MSITDSADYQRGLAVCDEHHPLRVNASGVGIRTMTKADLIVLVGKLAGELAAYQSATGVFVEQGLVFVTPYNAIECIACGEQAHEEGGIRHMPDCAAEKLRALVAGEGE